MWQTNNFSFDLTIVMNLRAAGNILSDILRITFQSEKAENRIQYCIRKFCSACQPPLFWGFGLFTRGIGTLTHQ